MVGKNMNTSPTSNIENEQKNKHLFSHLDKDNQDDICKILDILQNNNLIDSWDLDRTDTHTGRAHNHYFFNSVLNNNSLNSIINNYLSGKDITEQLNKMIATKGEIMALTLKGTLDTKSIDFTKDLTEDTKAHLLKNVDDFRYITNDSTGATKIKTFSENLGLSRTDKPEVLLTDPKAAKNLQGSFNFEFNFDSKLNQEQKEAITNSLNEAFEETFNRYPQGFIYDLNSPHYSIKDNKLQITFNNLFQSSKGAEIYMFSKKKIKKDMEVLLKNLSLKADLDISFSDLKLAVSEDKLKEVIETKKRDTKPQAPKLQKSEEAQKLESEIDNIEPTWLNFLYGKSLKELKLLMENYKDTKAHIKAVKDFLGEEIAKEKIQEVDEKMKLISKREAELNAELTLKETVENLSKEVETLKDSVKDLTEENSTLKSKVENLTEENSTLKSKVENLSETLKATEEEFDVIEEEFVKLETDNVSLKHQVNAAKTYTATLQEEISTLKEKENSKNLEIERLKKELEISKSKEVSVADKADFEVSNKQQARQEARNKAKKHLDSVKKREDSKKKEDPKKSNIEDDFGDR